jgi:hypothetical protein
LLLSTGETFSICEAFRPTLRWLQNHSSLHLYLFNLTYIKGGLATTPYRDQWPLSHQRGWRLNLSISCVLFELFAYMSFPSLSTMSIGDGDTSISLFFFKTRYNFEISLKKFRMETWFSYLVFTNINIPTTFYGFKLLSLLIFYAMFDHSYYLKINLNM